jgi:hypothetical protein
MSKTKQAYFCYTCSEEVIFRGTRVRYNVDGTLHLCKPEDKLAYEKYREYLRHDKKRLNGEDFWKWKSEVCMPLAFPAGVYLEMSSKVLF